MIDIDDGELRRRYGGCYVATRGGEVVASAPTYDQLSDQLELMAPDWSRLIIEYVEPFDVVRVY